MQEIADTVSEYSPTIGRFLQRDPIGYWDSMNLQQYVLNNPINWIDPSGQDLVIYKEDVGTHYGVAVDTSNGVYEIDLIPGWHGFPISPAEIRIFPWKGYPGKIMGEPVRMTPEQGDQFMDWIVEYALDYDRWYVLFKADCRDFACILYEQAQKMNPNQEPQTCPGMPVP